ncbi:MAG: lysyl-tRNA synthetase class I [Flammeovirgaceae bacterium]|jgi:lysyl-tRNA synthetase class I
MKHLRQLIKETAPVIIGILFAFINNWNEDRKDTEYLNQIFSSIEKELEESNIDVKRVLPKQMAFIDSIETYLNNEDVSLYVYQTKKKNNEKEYKPFLVVPIFLKTHF